EPDENALVQPGVDLGRPPGLEQVRQRLAPERLDHGNECKRNTYVDQGACRPPASARGGRAWPCPCLGHRRHARCLAVATLTRMLQANRRAASIASPSPTAPNRSDSPIRAWGKRAVTAPRNSGT